MPYASWYRAAPSLTGVSLFQQRTSSAGGTDISDSEQSVPYGRDGMRWNPQLSPLLFHAEMLGSAAAEAVAGKGVTVTYAPFEGRRTSLRPHRDRTTARRAGARRVLATRVHVGPRRRGCPPHAAAGELRVLFGARSSASVLQLSPQLPQPSVQPPLHRRDALPRRLRHLRHRQIRPEPQRDDLPLVVGQPRQRPAQVVAVRRRRRRCPRPTPPPPSPAVPPPAAPPSGAGRGRGRG